MDKAKAGGSLSPPSALPYTGADLPAFPVDRSRFACFVAEGVVLDDKVEEVGRLFLDAGIEILATEGLVEIAEDGLLTRQAAQLSFILRP